MLQTVGSLIFGNYIEVVAKAMDLYVEHLSLENQWLPKVKKGSNFHGGVNGLFFRRSVPLLAVVRTK
jgi:hypothetical protein